MPTLGALIESTRHALSGFDSTKDAVTALSSPLTADALVVSVEDTAVVGGGSIASRGIAEVDFEIIRVKAIDPNTGELLLYPFGRGYRGTTATEHDAGAEIRFNPSWPASTVAEHINGVLTEIYPSLYAVKAHETVVPSDRGAVDLPETAVGVISVFVEDNTREDQWLREDRWTYNPDASTVGKGLRVGGRHRPGTALRVIYAERPGLFDLTGSTTQDFATVTGLDARIADLVQLGVASRMAPFVDVAKLPSLAAAAREAGDGKAPGTAGQTARLIYSLYRQRIDQEAAVLAKEHPIRLHRVGV